MRDHPHHGTEILGGEWGAKLTDPNIREKFVKSWQKILNDPLLWTSRTNYGADQHLLSKHVWPWAKHISISHDSYTCQKYPNTRPYPTQRLNEPNNFVASVVFENHTLTKECPKACRPKNHQDWKTC